MFKLDTEFYKLPLRVDAERLAFEVNQFTEGEWRPHPQGHAGNSALPLVSVKGEMNDEVRGPMLPTPFLQRSPYIRQILSALGAPIGRSRLMRIAGQADATEHVDTNYYWMHHIRVHIPAVTHPEVTFVCNGNSVHMSPGEVWIFDSWKPHNVLNPVDYPRIHLVADTVGSAAFWNLVAKAERPFSPNENGEQPIREIGFSERNSTEFALENENYPLVMSPFEQQALAYRMMEKLPEDYLHSPNARQLFDAVERLNQQWHGLWTRFKDREAGWPEYQAAIAQFDERLPELVGNTILTNTVAVIEALRQAIVRPAVTPEIAKYFPASAPQSAAPSPQPTPAPVTTPVPAPAPVAANVQGPYVPGAAKAAPSSMPGKAGIVPHLYRPLFIVSAPRSGSSMLFELLSRSPDVWTVGGESHTIIEGISELNPANRNFESNRLQASDATPEITEQLQAAFLAQMRNRHGNSLPDFAGAVRLLEKTPKNALRIPFLAQAFPEARFVYLYREPGPNISSILDAWRSQRFVTYPELPGWVGAKWSMLLTAGWQNLIGKSLPEIAAQQWLTANQTILDDLAALPADRWCSVSYEGILTNPQFVAQHICDFASLGWDQNVQGALPNSRHTLTAPDPEKWRKNEAEVTPFLATTVEISARVRPQLPQIPVPPPQPQIQQSQPPQAMQTPQPAPEQAAPAATPQQPQPDAAQTPAVNFSSEHTTSFPQLLSALGITLAVSTYQAGKMILVRVRDGVLNTHFCDFFSPMGLAYHEGQLAIGTKHEVWSLRNFHQLGTKVDPEHPADAVFLPGSRLVTGDIRIHEIAWGKDRELWAVNTRFSCLCTFDGYHSFVPRWKPPFIDAITAEDRCHLNGLAMKDGVPAYVTCHAPTNTPEGWRGHKIDGGAIVDVQGGEIILRGLSMPHSPRLHNGKLYFLESGHARFCSMDLSTGEVSVVAELPGFTRGLDMVGQFAFIGLSQVRETAVFSGVPISEQGRERQCGVWVVDTTTGNIVAFLRFSGIVQEIFAIQALPFTNPELITDNVELLGGSFFVPPEVMADNTPAEVQTVTEPQTQPEATEAQPATETQPAAVE